MAENSGFFASVGGDRKYNMDFLARWVASFIGNGVYDGELAVTAGDGMAVTLPAGRAWINGYHYRNDGPLTLPVDNADGVLHRKDTVVLRWDVNARSITAQVLTGTFLSSPIAPQITRSAEQYDLKLAEISIPAGTTAITQDLITDTRLNNDVCGIVTGVVNQVDTAALYQQIQADLQRFRTENEADFTAWFDSVKGILGTDEAGNLLAKINDLAGDGRTTETVKGNADAFAAHVAAVNPHGVTAAQAGAVPTSHLTDLSAHNGFVGKMITRPNNWITDMNSMTQIGIFEGIFNAPLANEPLDGGTNARRVIIKVSKFDTSFFQEFYYIDAWSEGLSFWRYGLPWEPWIDIGHGSTAADTTSINSALTLSTAAPSSTLAAGKLWGVY